MMGDVVCGIMSFTYLTYRERRGSALDAFRALFRFSMRTLEYRLLYVLQYYLQYSIAFSIPIPRTYVVERAR
jgi:hypothetical protein